jgi:Protein of unknown function (DUF2630)
MLAGRDGRATVVLGVRPLRCERIDWEVEADMDDPQIHGAIEELVAEEHELWQREAAGAASEADRLRLEEIRVALDQCWDLLRQRRARRDAAQDPDTAAARPADVVERYEQ